MALPTRARPRFPHSQFLPAIKKPKMLFRDKSQYSQSYGFSSGMYGCESWTIKKTEHQRLDVFEFWYVRRVLALDRL